MGALRSGINREARVIGWIDGCKNLEGLGSESKSVSVVSTAAIFKWELKLNILFCVESSVSNQVWSVSLKNGPKSGWGGEVMSEIER